MLEDLLLTFTSLFPSGDAFGGGPEAQPTVLILICCTVGAVILSRYTGNMGNLTIPVNFSALFIGSLLSNWLLGRLHLPVDRVLVQPLLITLVGMVAAAFCLMMLIKSDSGARV